MFQLLGLAEFKHFFFALRVELCLLHLRCSLLTVTPSDKQSFQNERAENFFLVTIFIPPTLLNTSLSLASLTSSQDQIDLTHMALPVTRAPAAVWYMGRGE